MSDIAPWAIGPYELIKHGEEHMERDSDFDRRMALISFDNAIEVAITTFLQIHPKQRGGKTYRKDQVNHWKSNYHHKIEFLEEYVQKENITFYSTFANILWYHQLRNELYHSGNGFVPEKKHVDGIHSAAKEVFSTLFVMLPTPPKKDTISKPKNLLSTYLRPKQLHLLQELDSQDDHVISLSFSPNGDRLVSATQRNGVKIWNTSNWSEVSWFDYHPLFGIGSIAYSSDGNVLAIVSTSDITLWDVENRQELLHFNEHSDDILGLCFSPDGKYLASASHEVFLWDVRKGQLVKQFPNREEQIISIAITPDSKYLVAGGQNLFIWEIETGSEMLQLPESPDVIMDVALSSDGRLLATAELFGGVRLRDMQTKEELIVFEGFSGISHFVSFAQNDTVLISAGEDKTIRLWNLLTFDLIQEIEIKQGISDMAIHPSGNLIASCSGEQYIKLWELK